MDIEELFGRRVLEAYLAVAVAILTVMVYIILGSLSFQQQSGFVMLAILLIILIGVNILHVVIEMRVLDNLK